MIEFDNYLSPGRKGHLVGIGGVSMSSLAEVLKGMGISVVGSDMNENPNVMSLRAMVSMSMSGMTPLISPTISNSSCARLLCMMTIRR